MIISDRQVCVLANVILAATNTLDEAAAGTISRDELIKTMLLLESTIHGLNVEFMKYSQLKETGGTRN